MQKVTEHSNVENSVLSVPDVSAGIPNKTDQKLRLADEELLRMEDEGGLPLTRKQNAKISASLSLRRRIKKLLFIIGNP